jgi:hypothetical protein
MKKFVVLLFFLVIGVSFLSALQVEYSLDLQNDVTGEKVVKAVVGDALYITYPENGQAALHFDAQSVSGARFFRVRLSCITLLGAPGAVSLAGDGRSLTLLGETERVAVTPFMETGSMPEQFTLTFSGPFMGLISKIAFDFRDTPPGEITLKHAYEGVNNERGIITASGFAKFGKGNDASVRLEAERAAKVTAYRNLGLLLRDIAQKEGFGIDEARLDVTIRGARVLKKELTKEGVVVTVGIAVNGTPGLSDIVKEGL